MAPHLNLAIDRVKLPYDRAFLCDGRPRLGLDSEQGKQSNPHSRSGVAHGLPPEGQRRNSSVQIPVFSQYRSQRQRKYNLRLTEITIPVSVLMLQQVLVVVLETD